MSPRHVTRYSQLQPAPAGQDSLESEARGRGEGVSGVGLTRRKAAARPEHCRCATWGHGTCRRTRSPEPGYWFWFWLPSPSPSPSLQRWLPHSRVLRSALLCSVLLWTGLGCLEYLQLSTRLTTHSRHDAFTHHSSLIRRAFVSLYGPAAFPGPRSQVW